MNKERGNRPKEQFRLTAKHLTVPGGSWELTLQWLERVIGFQLEGLEHGIRPQSLIGASNFLSSKWRSAVWQTYLRGCDDINGRAVSLRDLARSGSFRRVDT